MYYRIVVWNMVKLNKPIFISINGTQYRVYGNSETYAHYNQTKNTNPELRLIKLTKKDILPSSQQKTSIRERLRKLLHRKPHPKK